MVFSFRALLPTFVMAIVPHFSYAVDFARHPYDKAAHIALGGALSYVVTRAHGPAWGLAAAAGAGLAKELSDRRFSRADIASWVAGGALGALIAENLIITPAGVYWRADY